MSSATNPTRSGVLAVEDGSQSFVNHWCELKNLTLNIYRTSQEKKPMISALLPGYTVVASPATHPHDRIIQLTHLSAPRPILIKVRCKCMYVMERERERRGGGGRGEKEEGVGSKVAIAESTQHF